MDNLFIATGFFVAFLTLFASLAVVVEISSSLFRRFQ